jgi:2-polyprenyl-3-methyl-5-hydroxy-6-metoxy-1,4-benzoquinol methylase
VTWTSFATAVVKDHQLARRLGSAPLRDAALERHLTGVRRQLLLQGAGPQHTPLLAHLALQGFINEYAWWEAPDETARLAEIARRDDDVSLLLYAAYRPLSGRPDAQGLLARETGPYLAAIIRQIADGRDEAELAGRIETITPIADEVSQAVQAQYEANPYPRWVELHAAAPMDEEADMLIAGCGTGRNALSIAKPRPRSRVLAVDLSRASLAYAMRAAQTLGIDNITFAQADLLALGALGRTFDVIECSGVLHHMADPFAGARVLAGLLRPGGRMDIGVYSTVARAYLAPAKALAAAYPPTTEGIRALRRAILDAPAGSPLREVATSGDFYSVSACRDLLMHVQEHTLTPGDLQRMLDENGLALEAVKLPPPILDIYRGMFPGAPLTDLARWAKFEEHHPATFRGMYQISARKRL